MTAARWSTVGFVAAGLSFLLFPLLRPWPDETVATAELATGFASGRWVVAHLAGILGLGLLAPALLGLRAPDVSCDATGTSREDDWLEWNASRSSARRLLQDRPDAGIAACLLP